MKKILMITLLLFSIVTTSQSINCDSIIKQMDFEIKKAKANKVDAALLKQLEETKQMLKKMYCESNNFGGGNNNNTKENQNIENNTKFSPINIPKQRAYKGTPFNGKHKISITTKSTTSEGNQNYSYCYYLNKEGSLVLLDKECIANANTLPQFSEQENGEFQYWAIRNDGISTLFALSKENGKVAMTTDIQDFMLSKQENDVPTIKK
ncbi:MAG: hypothetical protein HC798_03425 [Polaribacter sp.]|nr:hypothetical protein [Polaribacter sp.]